MSMSFISAGSKGNEVFAHWMGVFYEKAIHALAGAFSWHIKHKKTTLIIVLALFMGLAYSTGATPFENYGEFPVVDDGSVDITSNTSNRYQFNAEQLAERIASLVDTELTKLSRTSSLTGWGTTLTGFFLIALMIWGLLKNLAGAKGLGEWIGDLVPLFVSFGIVYAFLNKAAGDAIVSTMDMIGAGIGGNSWSSIGAAVKAVAVPMFKSMSQVMDFPRTNAAATGLTSWVTAIPSVLVSVLAKFLTVGLLVLGAVALLATVIMSFISVKLVIALAPVMVPFLMFQPLSWIFDSWLRFLLGACMMKVVAGFLIKMASSLLVAMQTFSLQIFKEAQGANGLDTLSTDLMLHAVMLIFALLAVLLMLQAPTISTGLLQGSAGGVGFKGVSGVTQSAAGKTMKFAVSSAGSATAAVAKSPFQAVAGHVQGKGDAYRLRAGSDRLGSSAKGGSEKMSSVKAFAYQRSYKKHAQEAHGPLKPKEFLYR